MDGSLRLWSWPGQGLVARASVFSSVKWGANGQGGSKAPASSHQRYPPLSTCPWGHEGPGMTPSPGLGLEGRGKGPEYHLASHPSSPYIPIAGRGV